MKELLAKSVNLVPWGLRQQVRRVPIVRELQRWLVTRMSGGEFVHRINAGPAAGLRFPVSLPDDKPIWAGTYEADFAAALRAAVRPGDVCLDIGAYRGFFSAVMALAGASRVHAFDPNAANQATIRRVQQLNPDLPIALHAAAVGSTVGQTSFVVMEDASMGKLSDTSFQSDRRSTETVSVRVETIDHLVAEGAIGPPQVVKIDVEGYEAEVLRGASHTLSQARPQLFIEIHSAALGRECDAILQSHDYRVTYLTSGKPYLPDNRAGSEVFHLRAAPLDQPESTAQQQATAAH